MDAPHAVKLAGSFIVIPERNSARCGFPERKVPDVASGAQGAQSCFPDGPQPTAHRFDDSAPERLISAAICYSQPNTCAMRGRRIEIETLINWLRAGRLPL
jgi:hypothetical protein